MQEKIGFLKWFTGLNDNKRSITVSVILIFFIYGFINRNEKERNDNLYRVISERDYLQKAFENERKSHDFDNARHLQYVEEQAERLEALRDRTEQLEKKRK